MLRPALEETQDLGRGLGLRYGVGDTLGHLRIGACLPASASPNLGGPLHLFSALVYAPSLLLFHFIFPDVSSFWLLSFFSPHLPTPTPCTPPIWDMTLSPLCQGTPVILAGADPSRAPRASSHPSLSPSLSHLSQREDAAELGGRLVNSLVDHGRNSDLSDIQEEEEEEEGEELGSTTCSFQKQVVGHSIRENGAKVMGGGGAGGP